MKISLTKGVNLAQEVWCNSIGTSLVKRQRV